MKKTLLLILGVILTYNCYAQQTQRQEAIMAALSVLNTNRNNGIESVCVKTNVNGDTLLYEVTTDENFSVFVSGNKKSKPILGVCENYGTPILHSMDHIPEGLKFLIDSYCDQIDYMFDANGESFITNPEWSELTRGDRPVLDTIVHKLLTTHWGQTVSNDGNDPMAYNYYMPQGVCSTGSHCPAGCAAVAMGQIMKYWNYPYFYSLDLDFDWCYIPDALYTSSSNYVNERNMISYLLLRCGEAVDMNYCMDNSCDESGVQAGVVDDVLLSDFGYSGDIVFRTRANYQNNNEWISFLKTNLDNGWPVLYIGFNTLGGHIFVCDGYLSDNRFSFNWGWNGDYDNNWLTLDYLDPSGPNGLNPYQSQAGIFNVYPANYLYDYCDDSFSLYHLYHSYYDLGQHDFPPPYYNVPSNIAHLISVPEQYSSSWRTIPSGVTASYEAHRSVTLVPGFHAEHGSDFTVSIDPCAICENEQRSKSTHNTKGDWDETETPSAGYKSVALDHGIKLKVYPNPTDGLLTVEYNLEEDSHVDVSVYDMSGVVRQTLSQGEMRKGFNSEKHNVSRLPNGIYVVKVTIEGVSYTHKMIKQ